MPPSTILRRATQNYLLRRVLLIRISGATPSGRPMLYRVPETLISRSLGSRGFRL
jgi:hypothetical protein